MATREYGYPVWGTQGGGLVREVNGKYIFVEKPDCPGLDVGDEMPEEWGIVPANQKARDESEREFWGTDDQADFDAGVNELFDTLFAQAERGEIPLQRVGEFFPDDVRQRNS